MLPNREYLDAMGDYHAEKWEGPFSENILDHPYAGKAVRRLPGKFAGRVPDRAPEGAVGVVAEVDFKSVDDRFPYRIVWFMPDYREEWLNHAEFQVCNVSEG